MEGMVASAAQAMEVESTRMFMAEGSRGWLGKDPCGLRHSA
jgi:hypothetical protein